MGRLLLVSVLVLVLGCAAAPIRTEGVTGPVAWYATDVTWAKTTVDGREGERYSLTLVLKETSGAGITFTHLKRAVFQHHVRSSPVERTGRWRLQPHGELQFPFSHSWYCPQAFDRCLEVYGAPQWTITLTGTDDRCQPVQLVIDFASPPVQ